VSLASPVRQPPSVRHSASSSGPAARWMQPSTPPPPSRDSFAALTMASTLIFVMSLRTISRGMVLSFNFYHLKSSQCTVVLQLFHFGQLFPILTISAPAKVIVAAVHSAGAATAKLKIMDGFTLDDISAFLTSDCVPDNSRHNHSLFSAFLIFSFSPLPSVRRRRSGTAHFSRMEFFFISRSACLLPAS